MEIIARSGLSKPAVWRWQARYMEEGVDGFLRDKTRKLGKAPLPAETVARVVELTLGESRVRPRTGRPGLLHLYNRSEFS